MGGGLVTSLAILHPELFDGIILQSPMLKVISMIPTSIIWARAFEIRACQIPQGMHPSWVVEQLLRVVARIAPKAPIVGRSCGKVGMHACACVLGTYEESGRGHVPS